MRACARGNASPLAAARPLRPTLPQCRALSTGLRCSTQSAPSLLSRPPPLRCNMYAAQWSPPASYRSRYVAVVTHSPFYLPRSISQRRSFHSTPPRQFLDTMIGSFTSRLKKVWTGDGKAPAPAAEVRPRRFGSFLTHRRRQSRRPRLQSPLQRRHNQALLPPARRLLQRLRRACPSECGSVVGSLTSQWTRLASIAQYSKGRKGRRDGEGARCGFAPSL